MIDQDYILNDLIPFIEGKIKDGDNEVIKLLTPLMARIETLESDRIIMLKKIENLENRL